MAISSGERGTKSQQQDRQNQRDRERSVAGGGSGERGTRSQQQDRRNAAAGGGFSGGGLGLGGGGFGGRSASVIGNRFGAPSASAQAAARARNAPTNGPLGGMNPQHYGGRRTTNPTPSYDMSLHNMYELSKMMPGPGMGLRGMGAVTGLGLGPQFEGYRGQINGPGDYDGPNRFATMGSAQYPNQPPRPQIPRPPTPGTVGQSGPMFNFSQAPGMTIQSGLPGYTAYRPGYDFITPPGMGRPGMPRRPTGLR